MYQGTKVKQSILYKLYGAQMSLRKLYGAQMSYILQGTLTMFAKLSRDPKFHSKVRLINRHY